MKCIRSHFCQFTHLNFFLLSYNTGLKKCCTLYICCFIKLKKGKNTLTDIH